MASINRNYEKLQGAYLFEEVARRVKDFAKKNPGAEIFRLGIGDTTLPLTPAVIQGLKRGVEKLGQAESYRGYGEAQGDVRLRIALADYYKKSGVELLPEEIFVSDGAKSDCANIQSIFGPDNIVAVADPVYPVYADASVIAGRTILYMPCNEENGFMPAPPKEKADLIYLCSPNNPTGAAMAKDKLQTFVDWALAHKAVIIFDAAYAEYISDPALPKSIYEIPGAKKCAIEINSFSKWSGFTGVRLGWSTVPMDLVVEGISEDKIKGKVNGLWKRRIGSTFNGASGISQEGGLAALSPAGLRESKKLVAYYMQNAAIIKENLLEMGFRVFGGEHSPYIWCRAPASLSSSEFFDRLLQVAHVLVTPGSGFGREGEGYVRFSAFGERRNIEKAIQSIRKKSEASFHFELPRKGARVPFLHSGPKRLKKGAGTKNGKRLSFHP